MLIVRGYLLSRRKYLPLLIEVSDLGEVEVEVAGKISRYVLETTGAGSFHFGGTDGLLDHRSIDR